ncbi:hypothetical protein [Sphingomonas sp. SAFR-052]|uniref:hypothetical protein n=1 Tax=Sphingomonas sp. SAFR-052 TaxID=3436867 RepID=UPI003F7F9761
MSGGVPAGWVLVPIEPTEAMRDDGIWALPAHSYNVDVGVIWSAMLSAVPTPTPPIEGRDADVDRVDHAIEMVLHHSSLNGTIEQIEQAARQIRAALQALGER